MNTQRQNQQRLPAPSRPAPPRKDSQEEIITQPIYTLADPRPSKPPRMNGLANLPTQRHRDEKQLELLAQENQRMEKLNTKNAGMKVAPRQREVGEGIKGASTVWPVKDSREDEDDEQLPQFAEPKTRKNKSKTDPSPSEPRERKYTGAPLVAKGKFSGWLMKKGGGSSIFSRKNWLLRWFVLDSGLLIYSEMPGTESLGAIRVGIVEEVISDPNNNELAEFPFSVKTPARTYHFVASNYDEKQSWMAAIEAAMKLSQKNKSDPTLLF